MSQKNNKYGLVISVTYKNNPKISNLNATSTDGDNMVNYLRDKAYEIVNMNDHRLNSTSRYYPTKNNIYKQIREILRKAKKTDYIFIYYSGHGSQLGYSNANREESDKMDECIIPVDYNPKKKSSVITDDEISKLLSTFLKNKKTVSVFMMFDCCHSGTICDLKYTYNYNRNNNKFVKNESTPKDSIDAHVLVLSGCKDDSVSWEDIVEYSESNASLQGILTGSFLYNTTTNKFLEADVFKLVKAMDPITKKYSQYPSISSNRDISDNSNLRNIFRNFDNSSNENDIIQDKIVKKKPNKSTIPLRTNSKPTNNLFGNTNVIRPTNGKTNIESLNVSIKNNPSGWFPYEMSTFVPNTSTIDMQKYHKTSNKITEKPVNFNINGDSIVNFVI